jgi:NADP-dependent 3-hydroxy acid dehydrogenase YdfG
MVTRGNSGIGLDAARLFVAEGAHVVITGRNQKILSAAAPELGNRVLAIRADVTDVEATERAVAAGSWTQYGPANPGPSRPSGRSSCIGERDCQ